MPDPNSSEIAMLSAPALAPALRPTRFIAAGAPTVRDDGTLDESLEAHMQCAWLNLFDAMKAAGFEKRHLINSTVYVTIGGQARLYRTVRDQMLGRHFAASSYLHVEGFESPGRFVEIECEAAKD